MGRTLLIIGMAIGIGSAGPATAAGLPSCASRADVVDGLSKAYEELPRGLGLTGSGGVVEVLTSPSGDTWSIIVTWPDGRSCLVAAGESWQTLNTASEPAADQPL